MIIMGSILRYCKGTSLLSQGHFSTLRRIPRLHFQIPKRFEWLRTQKSVLHHGEEGLRIKTWFLEGSGRNQSILENGNSSSEQSCT